MANKVDLGCLFPCMNCSGFVTTKAVVTDDVETGVAVEFVSEDAKGVKTYKKLTDKDKFAGVVVSDVEANGTTDIMVAGQVNVDALILDASIKPTDLNNTANGQLILRREV